MTTWLTHGLLVGTGGFLGAVARYAVSGAVHRFSGFAAFPYGTLVVNLTGCAAIGLLAGWTESRQFLGPEARLFLFIGVLGSFTTFSTFGYETLALLRDGASVRAAANILLHVGVGIAAAWGGLTLSRLW